MGIYNLTKLLGDNAPNAIKENQLKDHFGRKIAIDARYCHTIRRLASLLTGMVSVCVDSMCLYQFLIAIRTGGGPDGGMLANEAGEITRYRSDPLVTLS